MCFYVSSDRGVTCRKKIRWKLGSFEERRSDALNSIHGADDVLGVQLLNVLPIVTAHLVTGGHIFQNIADFPGRADRDRQTLIHLGRVPVHLRETENFLRNLFDRALALRMRTEQQRVRNIEAGIGPIVRNAAVGIEQPISVQLNEGAAEDREVTVAQHLAVQAAATRCPTPQTAARSFKPPFWKFESEIRQNGNPECPQTLVCSAAFNVVVECQSANVGKRLCRQGVRQFVVCDGL